MPSVSRRQHNLMELVAHDPDAAKRTGIPRSVGADFVAADRGRFAEGGQVDDDDSWLWGASNAVGMETGGRYKKPTKTKIPGYGEVEVAPLEPVGNAYTRFLGKPYQPMETYPAFDEDRARRIGEAYERMKHDPSDPKVKRAYDAMIEETLGQYKALKGQGYDFTFNKPGESDPYAASPALGYLDLRDRGHLSVFPTESGFGTLGALDVSANPLLQRVGRVGDLDNATANDAFRVVHDMYGHFGPGNPFFRHKGEERAWLNHAQMYSPEAIPAMTSETRGQNSWLNFGPYGERNRNASSDDTVFADQKSGLMEPFTWEDTGYASGGRVDPAMGYMSYESGSPGKRIARGSRNIEFVPNLDELFGAFSKEGSQLVREHAEKTGKEGLIYGNEFFRTPLARGVQTGVAPTDTRAFQQFIDQSKQQDMPFFTVHSHPVVTKEPLPFGMDTLIPPWEGSTLATTGDLHAPTHPSIADLRMLTRFQPTLQSMMIEGAGGTNNRTALVKPDYNVLSPSMGFMMARRDLPGSVADKIKDYNVGAGLHEGDPSGYSLMVNQELANKGMPMFMDKEGATSGPGIPFQDLLPDFSNYIAKNNIKLFARGGRFGVS